jgi:hypothetical protein
VVGVGLLPRGGHVLVTVVVRVAGTLVLEVLLVVASRVVLPGSGLGLGDAGSVLPQEFVDERFLLHGVDVHVGDGGAVVGGEFGAGVSAPVGLDALHVPLVDHGHGVLGLEGEELAEDAFVPVVDQDGLLLGRSLVEQSHQEVDPAAVHRFREGLPAPHVHRLVEVLVFAGPRRRRVEGREKGAPQEGVEVEVGLQPQGLDGDRVELNSAEDLLGLVLGRVFERKGGFESGLEEVEVAGRSCVGNCVLSADSKAYLQVR